MDLSTFNVDRAHKYVSGLIIVSVFILSAFTILLTLALLSLVLFGLFASSRVVVSRVDSRSVLVDSFIFGPLP